MLITISHVLYSTFPLLLNSMAIIGFTAPLLSSFRCHVARNAQRTLSILNLKAHHQRIPVDESSSSSSSDIHQAVPVISSPLLANRREQQYSDILETLFQKNDVRTRTLKINSYWYESLQRVNKHKARVLVSQLNPSCPLGFDPLASPSVNVTSDDEGMDTFTATASMKKGSLLSFVREQKERYPECILLTRVGEFYEAYGVDAILLVEHCGLNPM